MPERKQAPWALIKLGLQWAIDFVRRPWTKTCGVVNSFPSFNSPRLEEKKGNNTPQRRRRFTRLLQSVEPLLYIQLERVHLVCLRSCRSFHNQSQKETTGKKMPPISTICLVFNASFFSFSEGVLRGLGLLLALAKAKPPQHLLLVQTFPQLRSEAHPCRVY